MSIEPTGTQPESFAHLPEPERFDWLKLRDAKGVYGHAALADQGDWLELHLELERFGPQVMRAMRADFPAIKAEAEKRGKAGLIGMKVQCGEKTDPKWPKFTKLFGFESHTVAQCAVMPIRRIEKK